MIYIIDLIENTTMFKMSILIRIHDNYSIIYTELIKMYMQISMSSKYSMIFSINFAKNTVIFKMYMPITTSDRYSMSSKH